MQYILLAGALIGLIQSGIQLAEKLMTGKGNGAVKKDAVIEGVAGAIATGVNTGVLRGDFVGLDMNTFKPVLGMFIDLQVAIMNKLGWAAYTLDSPDTSENAKLNAVGNQA